MESIISVMVGLVPAIHDFLPGCPTPEVSGVRGCSGMAGSSPAMTARGTGIPVSRETVRKAE